MTGLKLVAGSDALDLLLDVRLDGFVTGYASAMLMIAKAAGMSQQEGERYADEQADQACSAMKRDPLVMEMQRQEILERLTGTDSGPYTVKTTDGGV